MFVEVAVVAALLMPVGGQAACPERTTCVFYRDELTLSCGGETCGAVDPAEPIPAGYYLIGPHYVHEGHRKSWFNLYPFAGSRYWDYYTRVPGLGCLGHLGLHSGLSWAAWATSGCTPGPGAWAASLFLTTVRSSLT